jgi:hypothetical protein
MRKGHKNEVLICCEQDIREFVGYIGLSNQALADSLSKQWSRRALPFSATARLTSIAMLTGLQLNSLTINDDQLAQVAEVYHLDVPNSTSVVRPEILAA